MKRYRYEAIDSSGTPIFGVHQCDHVDELIRLLKSRGQQLKNSTELSLEEFNRKQAITVPRLFQLRVGERIHDALLTGLPAHEAVRAIASEPIQAPLLFAVPWCYFLALLAMLTVWGAFSFGYLVPAVAIGLLLLTVVLVLAAHYSIRQFLYERPRRLLHQVASQLEKGFQFEDVTKQFLPQEMSAILNSKLDDETKGRAVSDIMPALQVRSNHLQRLAIAIAIPLAIFALLNHILWVAAKLILPYYSEVFSDFGIEVPAITKLVLDLGEALSDFNWSTMWGFAIFNTVFIVCGALVIANGWGHDWLARIPWFGAMFKWSMQARVLRMMATLCRNGAQNSEILGTSTRVSGFRSVKLQGQYLVAAIEQGDENWPIGGALAGLPISLLKGTHNGESGIQQRVGISATFEHLSHMLEQAAMTQAAVLATMVRFFVFGYAIVVVVNVELAILLPLLRLLNAFA